MDLEYHKYGVLINYFLLLINQKQEYNRAFKELKMAEKYYKKQNAIEPLIAIYDNLAKAYYKKENLQKAINIIKFL